MEAQKIAWKGTATNTTEFVVIKQDTIITVDGHITGEEEGVPLHVHYTLSLDSGWIIQSVTIDVEATSSYRLHFEKNAVGNWMDEKGKHLPALDGCIDIDLSVTPFTNTLPINRLRLAKGESSEINVLYFKLPEGKYQPFRQRYTNIDDVFYKYESIGYGYVTVLETDQHGFVKYYPGRWDRTYPAP